jgi:signal transduction histidine kinase
MRRVSHELRSPLSAISSSLQVVVEGYVGVVPERAAEIVLRARERVEEMLRLVNDLLALTRARTAKPREYLEPVSLPVVAGEVLQLLTERAEQKGIRIVNAVPAELPAILADREGIVQLVTNLTANAVKYTDQGGRVTVSGYQDGQWLAVSVSDTGIGIQPDDIPHLFEEFYRTKRGREFQSVGTGLGLAITKAILDQHEGRISVESEPGVGTMFLVLLPIEGPHKDEAAGRGVDLDDLDIATSTW